MKLPDEIRSKLKAKNLRRIEPKVRDLTFVEGDDSTGDPAVFFSVVLDDSVTDRQLLSTRFQPVRDWLRKTVWVGTDFNIYPYVSLTRFSEEKEAVA